MAGLFQVVSRAEATSGWVWTFLGRSEHSSGGESEHTWLRLEPATIKEGWCCVSRCPWTRSLSEVLHTWGDLQFSRVVVTALVSQSQSADAYNSAWAGWTINWKNSGKDHKTLCLSEQLFLTFITNGHRQTSSQQSASLKRVCQVLQGVFHTCAEETFSFDLSDGFSAYLILGWQRGPDQRT